MTYELKNQTMQVNGFEIEYIQKGVENSKTLVFAHGLGGNVTQWTKQIDYFSARYHVIAFSLQGHGHSSRTDHREDYEIEAYARTVTLLLKALDIDNFTWIGNSMGGVIGYEILKQNQFKIDEFITNGTTPELIFNKAGLKLVRWMDVWMMKLMGFDKYIRFAAKNTTKNPEIITEIYNMMIQTHPFTIIESHQLLGNYSYIETLENTDIPATFILTEKDSDINKSITQARGKSNLDMKSNIQFIEQAGYGHVFNMEGSDDYNLLLKKILHR